MKSTIIFVLFLEHLLLTTQLEIHKEDNKNITLINGTSLSSTINQVAGQPIVIHTQIQYYDQPTLRDYQECYENLQKCKTVCEGVKNPLECVKQCPVCPLLIKEEIVVQGVNDTDYKPVGPPPLNTTNIIRLTNEIHNIIESQQGNMSYSNKNIVHVYQNISRVGGKFGLGYNNTDPCCIILRPSKTCDFRRFSTSARCHRKRHRVCSKKCNSRVMQAKRVTVCEKTNAEEENDEYIDENCYETVKYVPYRGERRRVFRQRNKCIPTSSWPYVLCGQHGVPYRNSICSRCRSLTFQYILRRGIPPQCSTCFMSHSNPINYETYPMWRTTGLSIPDVNYGIDFDDEFDLETSNWHHDRTMCQLPNGEISQNCSGNENIGTVSPMSTSTTDASNTWDDNLPEAQDEYMAPIDNEEVDDYDYNDENILRKRRYAFTPSKYSRRHRL